MIFNVKMHVGLVGYTYILLAEDPSTALKCMFDDALPTNQKNEK